MIDFQSGIYLYGSFSALIMEDKAGWRFFRISIIANGKVYLIHEFQVISV